MGTQREREREVNPWREILPRDAFYFKMFVIINHVISEIYIAENERFIKIASDISRCHV